MSSTPVYKREGEEIAPEAATKRTRNTATIASVYKEKQSGAFAFGFGGGDDYDGADVAERNEESEPVHTLLNLDKNTDNVANTHEHLSECTNAQKGVVRNDEPVLRSSIACIAVRDHWAPGMTGKVVKERYYNIIWEKSSDFSLCVTDSSNVDIVGPEGHVGREYFVPPSVVRLVRSRTDEKSQTLKNDTVTNTDSILHYDSTWLKASCVLGYDLPYSNTPSLLEPGLECFVWPLSADTFMKNVFQQKALVVHGTGQRLEELRKDFHDLDVEEMVQEASRVVVWMKTKQGKMQYIDAGPDIAINCYRAGHTLYFNPSLDVQRKYFDALTDSLGMKCIDFGMNRVDDFGGDIEIFAVDRAHDTPWHFDAQENFTIQLRGTKRWSVCKSDLKDIVTNLHPDSTNIEAVYNDYKTHSGYTGTRPTAPKEGIDDIYTFVLRPGSILYAPAGMWHRVQCENEDGGSLSMNFSVDGRRWADLFASRLQPLLWKNAGWRGRIQDMNPKKARETLNGLLEKLKDTVSRLTADDFLPPAILDSNAVSDEGDSKISLFRVHAEIGDEDREMQQAITEGQAVRERYPNISSSSFIRNPLCDLVMESSSASGTKWTVNSGYTKDNLASDYCRAIFVPHEAYSIMSCLMNMSTEKICPTTFGALLRTDVPVTTTNAELALAKDLAETLLWCRIHRDMSLSDNTQADDTQSQVILKGEMANPKVGTIRSHRDVTLGSAITVDPNTPLAVAVGAGTAELELTYVARRVVRDGVEVDLVIITWAMLPQTRLPGQIGPQTTDTVTGANWPSNHRHGHRGKLALKPQTRSPGGKLALKPQTRSPVANWP
ncbi:hypothetical protein SARC_01034 [Sphaeroforma arctica JP610]|uniref:JmjC domain-containing protein n=1 Tax=Sphaeroforma arctica JP610 TaxID=667725 RepID=A0A0L0GD76_9EUKA|nr:hypothetical protein SARC_01034 [Sphaeroforma arctica JP610]KNC86841.1 hypothetical protein SARC_01034 [Sphaeroforma arctica JP610]|eukprot:XP_014160743.1 hypothetical protein SARC_01034 [Sphaeroforma arctica JP610]